MAILRLRLGGWQDESMHAFEVSRGGPSCLVTLMVLDFGRVATMSSNIPDLTPEGPPGLFISYALLRLVTAHPPTVRKEFINHDDG